MEHILKILGTSELPEPLEHKKDYLFSINATITNIDKGDDEKGGVIYTYKAKQRTVEILKDNGVIMVAKVRGSQSQKLRLAILNANVDYDETMTGIRKFLPEVIDLIKKLEQ